MSDDDFQFSDLPGAEHPWLRRALRARVSVDPPPLTLDGVDTLRRIVVLQLEHGVLRVREGRAMLRELARHEEELLQWERR